MAAPYFYTSLLPAKIIPYSIITKSTLFAAAYSYSLYLEYFTLKLPLQCFAIQYS